MSNRKSKDCAPSASRGAASTLAVKPRKRRKVRRRLPGIGPHAPARRSNRLARCAFAMAPDKGLNLASQVSRDGAIRNARRLPSFGRFRILPPAAEATRYVRRAIEIDGPKGDLGIERRERLTGHDARLTETGEVFGQVRTGRSNPHEAELPRARDGSR